MPLAPSSTDLALISHPELIAMLTGNWTPQARLYAELYLHSHKHDDHETACYLIDVALSEGCVIHLWRMLPGVFSYRYGSPVEPDATQARQQALSAWQTIQGWLDAHSYSYQLARLQLPVGLSLIPGRADFMRFDRASGLFVPLRRERRTGRRRKA